MSVPCPASSAWGLGCRCPQVSGEQGCWAKCPGCMRAAGGSESHWEARVPCDAPGTGTQTPAGTSEAASPLGRTVCPRQPPHPRGGQQPFAVYVDDPVTGRQSVMVPYEPPQVGGRASGQRPLGSLPKCPRAVQILPRPHVHPSLACGWGSDHLLCLAAGGGAGGPLRPSLGIHIPCFTVEGGTADSWASARPCVPSSCLSVSHGPAWALGDGGAEVRRS